MHIGIIGAGMIGSTMARLWVEAGHTIRVASRHPDELKPLVADLGANASAATPAEAAVFGEVVMITIPLLAVPAVATDLAPLLAGKIVIDTGNAYPQRDGDIAAEATSHAAGTAGWAAEMFPDARWVKAFNTVYFKVLLSEARRDGDRLGIPIASDDREAANVVARLTRDAGFEPVIVGGLARGREFEPGAPTYNTGMSGREIRAIWPTPDA
jgi:predicted dinucleotide-binding enzyme